jgi:hypothetical protein
VTNLSGQHHSSYRSIEQTPFADAEKVTSGEAITFGGNGAEGSWRSTGAGTLGFYGRDLGSSAPTQGRVPAFLGLAERSGGVYLERTGDNPPTVAEAMKRCGLDREVRLEPLSVHTSAEAPVLGDDGDLTMERIPTGDTVPMPGRWVATVSYPRDGGTPTPIAPCSPRYTVIQDDRALEIGDALSEGQLRALGAWDNGAKTYGAWELGEGMSIGGGDPYRNFVTIVNTQDGNGTYGLLAPIRLGCTNQTNATFGRKATPRFTIRHVGEAAFKLEEARRILGLSHHYLEALKEESETLLRIPMGKDRFLVFAKEVWGVNKPDEDMSKRSLSLVNARAEELLGMLDSPTCEFGKGTAYAGYQAVVEYLDFAGTVRGGDSPAERRWTRIMTGELDAAKTRAWELAAASA